MLDGRCSSRFSLGEKLKASIPDVTQSQIAGQVPNSGRAVTMEIFSEGHLQLHPTTARQRCYEAKYTLFLT